MKVEVVGATLIPKDFFELKPGSGKNCVVCGKKRKIQGWTCSGKCKDKHSKLLKQKKTMKKPGMWE